VAAQYRLKEQSSRYNTEMVTENERRATLADAQATAKAWESVDAQPGRLAQTRHHVGEPTARKSVGFCSSKEV
jgi:hypothetical protein